jgi:hypothetical protein
MLDPDYADAMVLVFIDGCCLRNGQSDASGGYGVHFGRNSKYNLSKSAPDTQINAVSSPPVSSLSIKSNGSTNSEIYPKLYANP